MKQRPAILFDRESIRVFIPQEAWVVYRLLDPEGELVYAGASGAPRTRLLAHLRDGKPARYVEIEFFRSSSAMARAERELLATEPTILPSGFGRRHAAWRARVSSTANVPHTPPAGPVSALTEEV